MSRLILASASPARARLLAGAGLVFTVQAAQVDEARLKQAALARGASPRDVALELALAKAQAVRDQTVQAPSDAIVLGADQTLELGGVLFDKPATLDDARTQLLTLRGRSHQLHSAVAFLHDDRTARIHVDSAILEMRAFSGAFLDDYLAQEGEALLGCVGGYRLEGLGTQLFAKIEGDYFTILGLPLLLVLAHLRACGALAT